jgi:hypothetical protein
VRVRVCVCVCARGPGRGHICLCAVCAHAYGSMVVMSYGRMYVPSLRPNLWECQISLTIHVVIGYPCAFSMH